MTFSVFLFILLFTSTTSFEFTQIWKIISGKESIEIPYSAEIELNHRAVYMIVRWGYTEIEILYWIGAQSSWFSKFQINYTVASLIESISKESSLDIRVIRETSKPNINKVGDLLSANGKEKTPRLYNVADAHTIRQIPLIYGLVNKDDSYVLDDRSSVTIYHSPTNKTKRKIADKLAKYIVDVENNGNYNLTVIPSSDGKEGSNTALKKFCGKILSTVQIYSTSKTVSLRKNYAENIQISSTDNDLRYTVNEIEYFEIKRKEIIEYLTDNMIMNDTDFMDDRILSSAKASTSTGSTHTNLGRKRMSQVIKRRNKSKKNSFSKSIFGGESTNVATTPADIDTIIETYKNFTPIFLGSEECAPEIPPPLIGTPKSMCAYMLTDLVNNEELIYFGKDVGRLHREMIMSAMEIDSDEDPLLKVTIVIEGNKIPTHLMIHIKTEVQKLLSEE